MKYLREEKKTNAILYTTRAVYSMCSSSEYNYVVAVKKVGILGSIS